MSGFSRGGRCENDRVVVIQRDVSVAFRDHQKMDRSSA